MADILKKAQESWQITSSEWSSWRQKAKQCYRFYRGQQWTAEEKEILERQMRPPLTFNKVKPVIRTISGWQRQNRQDLVVMPSKGGIQWIANVFTEILKYHYKVALADWKLSQAFVDGLITGKGWLAVDIRYDTDPINGELYLQRENPLMIYEDPFSQRYDLSDAKFIFRTYWMDKDELIAQFPKAKKDLSLLASISPSEREKVGVETQDYTDIQPTQSSEIGKYRFLVKEYWWREWQERKLIVDFDTLEVIDASEKEDEELQKIIDVLAQQGRRVKVVFRVMPMLHLLTFCGKVVLQEVEDPLGGTHKFPLVRYSPEFFMGDERVIKGEVEDLIDPQKEINKRYSQALDHLNRSANSGFFIEEGSMDVREETELENTGGRGGKIFHYRKGARPPQRIEPAALSQGHITLFQFGEDSLKKISGADLLGTMPPQNKAESGIAIQLKRQHGLTTTEQIFDNFEWTQRMLGELLLDLIRNTDTVSEEEIRTITDTSDELKGIDIKAFLSQRKVGKYLITLSTRANTPTERAAAFSALMELVKAGIPIDPKLIIKASDMPLKDEILKDIEEKELAAKGGVSPLPGGVAGRGSLSPTGR